MFKLLTEFQSEDKDLMSSQLKPKVILGDCKRDHGISTERELGFSDCSFLSRVSELKHGQPFWCDLCSDLLFVKGGVYLLTCKISLPSESALIIYYFKKISFDF